MKQSTYMILGTAVKTVVSAGIGIISFGGAAGFADAKKLNMISKVAIMTAAFVGGMELNAAVQQHIDDVMDEYEDYYVDKNDLDKDLFIDDEA